MKRALAVPLVTLLAILLLASACAPAAPTPTLAPEATKPPAATKAPEAAKPAEEAQAKAAPAQAAKTIKLGAISPLTGPGAAMGAAAKRGLDLAVEQINGSGGIKSIGGAKLELLHEDHQMRPDLAMGIAERMIQNDRVSVLLGSMISAVTIATTQVAERLKTPHLVPMSTADEITERGFKYTFRISANNSLSAVNQVDFVKWLGEKKGSKLQKIGLLYEDTAFGQGLAEMEKKAFTKQEGFDIVADLSYSAQGKDFSAVIAKLKAAAPDVVLESSYVADAILLKKTMELVGFKPVIVGTESGTGQSEYVSSLGEAADGDIVVTMTNRDLPVSGMGAYLSAFNAKYSQLPDAQATFNYQGMMVLKEALEKAGSDDREAIREALSKTSLGQGPSLVLPVDPLKFDEKGQSNATYLMTQLQKGSMVTVWPEKFKAADVMFR